MPDAWDLAQQVTAQPVQSGDAWDLAKKAQEEQPGLDAQARRLLSAPPAQMAAQEWVKRQHELEDQFGVGRVKLLTDDKDQPKGFEVEEKDIQGVWTTKRLQDDVVTSRIESIDRSRAELLKLIKEEGGALSFGERLAPGVAVTKETGTANILKEKYGQENVLPVYDADGAVDNFVILEPGKKPRVLEKRDEIEFADIADISGEMIETAPGVVGQLLATFINKRVGASGVGAAAISKGAEAIGDAVGTELRRLAANALGAQEQMTVGERIEAGLTNVIGGQVAGGVGAGVKKLAQTPAEIARRQISQEVVPETFEQAVAKPGIGERLAASVEEASGGTVFRGAGESLAAKRGKVAADIAREEGKALQERTGVSLSTGATTRAPMAVSIERYLAQTPAGRPIWSAKAVQNAQQLAAFADKTIDEVGPAWGSLKAGERVAEVYNSAIGKLKNLRQEAWNKEFDQAVKKSGNATIMDSSNYLSEVRKIKDEWVGSADSSAQRVIRTMEKFAKEIEERDSRKMTVREFQNRLASLRDLSEGRGTVVGDMNVSKSQGIARRLKNAMEEDLDKMVDRTGRKGEAAQHLFMAREGYRLASETIEASRANVLEKAFDLGDKGKVDSLAKSLVGSQFTDEEVRAGMRALSKMEGGKEAARALRRSAIEELLTGTKPEIKGILSGKAKYSPAKIATALENQEKRLQSLFVGESPEAVQKIGDIIEIGRRLAQTEGMVGSPTAPLGWMDNAFRAVVKGIVAPKQLITELVVYGSQKDLSIALASDEGRDIILEIVKPKAGGKALTAAQFSKLATRLENLVTREKRMMEEE